ncbi:uncharacterized protein [Cherax quadricarinatus]|uniref:uncharacterized protein isoform X1 n=1 Tax=Cherax quadricarinatus TaxID=27406 RepID=UPI00387ED100
MNVEMAERFEDITKEKLQNLKLQSCWQLARSLGIKYDRHFTAQTVRCMIQNVLFPDEQDPETENGEADIPSFLNSFLQTPEAETTTLTTPTGDDGHELPDTRKRYAATTTPIPSPRTIWGTELNHTKETDPGKPFTDSFETEQEVLLDDEHVPPQISLALLTTIQSKENFERLERILSLQTSFVEAQRKLKRENFERESLLYEREVLRKKRESSNMYTIPSFDLGKAASLMPKFTEDNLDSFFEAFENQAKVMQWPPKYWAALIHSSLIGKAQTITANLPFEQYSDYTQVKDCLLKAYDLLPVSYLKIFRTLKKYPQQSWVDFAREKLSAFERWRRAAGAASVESLSQLMLHEDLFKYFPERVHTYLLTFPTTNLLDTAAHADHFEISHAITTEMSKAPEKKSTSQGFSSRLTARKAPAGEPLKVYSDKKQVTNGSFSRQYPKDQLPLCLFCKKLGHRQSQCWHKQREDKTQPRGRYPTQVINSSRKYETLDDESLPFQASSSRPSNR